MRMGGMESVIFSGVNKCSFTEGHSGIDIQVIEWENLWILLSDSPECKSLYMSFVTLREELNISEP